MATQGGMRHRTMAEYALEQLRESIILGELAAGTPLRLDELARSLGMSISPIQPRLSCCRISRVGSARIPFCSLRRTAATSCTACIRCGLCWPSLSAHR